MLTEDYDDLLSDGQLSHIEHKFKSRLGGRIKEADKAFCGKSTAEEAVSLGERFPHLREVTKETFNDRRWQSVSQVRR